MVDWKEFQQRIIESDILTEAEVLSITAALPGGQDSAHGDALAHLLVQQGTLTEFQVQTIYRGEGKSLVLGNYVLLDKLGQGGMGAVYKAEHRRMRRLVALKVLAPHVVKSPELLERFQREVRAAARLEHPNIVTAYDADEARDTHFLVMQYVPGQDLAVFVRQHGPLPVELAVNCIIQAARGLQYAHERGVIHRDIKPANLLLDKSGVVKILDMGLARIDADDVQESELTTTGAVMGTVDYMSPEQAISTKIADARSDQYSLGLVLWYLLIGRPAYSGDSMMAKLLAHRDAPIPSLTLNRPDVPPMLEVVFQTMVAKRPESRYATLAEAADGLRACSLENPATAFETSDSQLQKSLQTLGKSAWEAATASGTAMASSAVGDRNEDTFTTEATSRRVAACSSMDEGQSAAGNSKISGKNRFLSWSVGGGLAVAFLSLLLLNQNNVVPSVAPSLIITDPSPVPSSDPRKRPLTPVWQITPEQQAFFDDVARLPAEQQTEAVRRKLVEINPGFGGQIESRIVDGHVTELEITRKQDITANCVTELWPVRALRGLRSLNCEATQISDLSPLKGLPLDGMLNVVNTQVKDLAPLRGMPLAKLSIGYTQVTDLSPLQGMPLWWLYLSHAPVADLSPLKGMNLSFLSCGNTHVSDLSPLAGMPLKYLACYETAVANLTPLKGMPLDTLYFHTTPVSDLSPLAGMPLTKLSFRETRVTDLAVLKELPLQELNCDAEMAEKYRDLLSGIRTLKVLKAVIRPPIFRPWKPTPEQQAFLDDVARLPFQQQCEAVRKKLVEANPGFDGQTFSWRNTEQGLIVNLPGVDVVDLWPLRALPGLNSLICNGDYGKTNKLRDLSPLAGLKLAHLSFANTEVSDLSPLSGMPLERLECFTTPVSDLSALAGMPLKYLNLSNTAVIDLAPLKQMPLEDFSCGNTRVVDLSPLVGVPLTKFSCNLTGVSDLSPLANAPLRSLNCSDTPVASLALLEGMALEMLTCNSELIERYPDLLRCIPTLKTINGKPASEALKQSAPMWKPTPEQQAFFNAVSLLPPAEQAQAVAKKLRDVNPGFIGEAGSRIEAGKVVNIGFLADVVTQIWPVRALSDLEILTCRGTEDGIPGILSDLSPLAGLELTSLVCSNTQVADLSPLAGMKLTMLDCSATQIASISPLRGMPLQKLLCRSTRIESLSPLAGAPLTRLECDNTIISDLSPLTGMQLTYLDIALTKASDLSPLAGMPLTQLHFYHTPIADLSPLKGAPLTVVSGNGSKISDLSPLAGMNLVQLHCGSTKVTDISVIKGMNLTELDCMHLPVSDLSPLKGMPLTSLNCGATNITDLSPLAGLPLEKLRCYLTAVSDLSPLKGLRLTYLDCGGTRVSDLSPLVGMPLEELYAWRTLASDLRPLAGLPLTTIGLRQPDRFNVATAAWLRNSPTIRQIAIGSTRFQMSAENFWREYDEHQKAIEEFVMSTAAKPVEERGSTVANQLHEWNAGLKLSVSSLPRNGEVSEVTLMLTEDYLTDFDTPDPRHPDRKLREREYDLAPLLSFPHLKKLVISGGPFWLDLTALGTLPLENIVCSPDLAIKNRDLFRSIKSLKTVNGLPAQEL